MCLGTTSKGAPTGRALLRRLSAATARGPDPHLTALAASPQLHPSRRGRRGRHASILFPAEIPFHRVVRLLAQARDPPHFLQLGRRSRLKRVMMPSAVRPRPGMPGRRPFSRSSNAMSYLFPQTSQVPIGLLLLRVGSFRASAACPEQPDTHVTNAARPRRRPPPDARAPPAVRRIRLYPIRARTGASARGLCARGVRRLPRSGRGGV